MPLEIFPHKMGEVMMRRSDKEVTGKADMEDIIKRSIVCRLALCEGDHPYIVPLSFGYKTGTLYFHSAPEGKKIGMLKKNPNVCFEFDVDCRAVEGKTACEWGMNYKSVIGYGRARIVAETREKQEALALLMQQYTDRSFPIPENMAAHTAVIKVEIESMTAKRSDKGD